MKSVKSNIVEGFGRRRYKQEYLRFLDFSYASLLETIDHLETLHETGSLTDDELFSSLEDRLTQLSKALFSFIRGVEEHHDPDRA
jgi:four helix bundle protein